MKAKALGGGIMILAGLVADVAGQEQGGAPPWPVLKPAADRAPLPGTKLLRLEGDISRRLHDGADRFLDAQIAASVDGRRRFWKRDRSSAEAYAKSIAPNRERFRMMLGLHRDARHDPEGNRLDYYSVQKAAKASAEGLGVYHVRWRVFGGVHGDGLLLEPEGRPVVADVIAIPDAGQVPEQLAGVSDADSPTPAFALDLARAGCRVLVPALIDRGEHIPGLTNREWLHRPAFELGRHLLGYEVQKVLAGVDCLRNTHGEGPRKVGVIGWGEGGLLAMYAAAVDPRIDAACVAGYFGEREMLWMEPAEHNVFGLLREFGDAEIASLIAPRRLMLIKGTPPPAGFGLGADGEPERLDERPKRKGKPGKFIGGRRFEQEVQRLLTMLPEQGPGVIVSRRGIAEHLGEFRGLLTAVPMPEMDGRFAFGRITPDPPGRDLPAERHAVQKAEIERHNQWALIQSRQDRAALFDSIVETDRLGAFEESVEAYRDLFRKEVVGEFEAELLPANPHSRKYHEGPLTTSYEVVLDVFPEVIAYGILTVPKDLDVAGGEKRPVVVCQHGLEGTPQSTVGEEKHAAYKAFATRLAERGFVTFAPQNLYKYFDVFRMQQFKAQSLGGTLFSVMVPSHRQITGWLASQPFVDAERIAFYGLSYGGKSAMRIPPLVDGYCLSICSADFNEWVWKNAATDPKSLRYSYANKSEYEIFEWNLGGTFNYAEMAALICPRPFMVERGHFDGVAPDETVAYEFAKVRHLYAGKLGIGDRCEIEWFAGPHTINGVGTYRFLHKHLRWPAPPAKR